MKLKTLRKIIVILISILASGAIGFWFGRHEIRVRKQEDGGRNIEIVNMGIPNNKDVDFGLFWETWQRLEESFIDKESIKYQEMVYGAIKGMVKSLGDPYTVFLPPKEKQRFDEDLNGSFGGVGIELGFVDGYLAVIAPLQGMPAEKVGIEAGDLILHLKDELKEIDENTQDITLPQAVEKIRGLQGTEIVLTILHEGETQPVEIGIVRDIIKVPSVKLTFGRIEQGKWQEKNEGEVIAFLQLWRFGENTDKDWDKSVQQIQEISTEGRLGGIVLDVRNNPGGYLVQAVNFASEFLKQGVVVKQENAAGQEKSFSINRQGNLIQAPLVVLVNKGSASASEILAGALQVHDRAELVGEKTFGKGTIQTAEELENGASIHITNARWLLPDGSFVEEGLEPDYNIEDNNETEEDEQLIRAIEILNQSFSFSNI